MTDVIPNTDTAPATDEEKADAIEDFDGLPEGEVGEDEPGVVILPEEKVTTGAEEVPEKVAPTEGTPEGQEEEEEGDVEEGTEPPPASEETVEVTQPQLSVEDIAALQVQNEELLKEVQQLSGQALRQGRPEVGVMDEPAAPPELRKFVNSNEDLAELFTDYNKVNEFAGKIVEQSMMSVPSVVVPMVQTAVSQVFNSLMFWQQNQDLTEKMEWVSTVANRFQAENPDWDFAKVSAAAAQHVREKMGVKRPVAVMPQKPPLRPVSPTVRARSPHAPVATTPLQEDLDNIDVYFSNR